MKDRYSELAQELTKHIALFYDRNYHDLLNCVHQFIGGKISQNELETLFDSFITEMHLQEREFRIQATAISSNNRMTPFLRDWYTRKTG